MVIDKCTQVGIIEVLSGFQTPVVVVVDPFKSVMVAHQRVLKLILIMK